MNFSDALATAGLSLALIGLWLEVTGANKILGLGLQAIGMWIGFVSVVADGSMWATVNGLLAIWCTYVWWKNRRNGRGKKALRELGARSRARVEAMVRQMTPSPIPSPVGGGA